MRRQLDPDDDSVDDEIVSFQLRGKFERRTSDDKDKSNYQISVDKETGRRHIIVTDGNDEDIVLSPFKSPRRKVNRSKSLQSPFSTVDFPSLGTPKTPLTPKTPRRPGVKRSISHDGAIPSDIFLTPTSCEGLMGGTRLADLHKSPRTPAKAFSDHDGLDMLRQMHEELYKAVLLDEQEKQQRQKRRTQELPTEGNKTSGIGDMPSTPRQRQSMRPPLTSPVKTGNTEQMLAKNEQNNESMTIGKGMHSSVSNLDTKERPKLQTSSSQEDAWKCISPNRGSRIAEAIQKLSSATKKTEELRPMPCPSTPVQTPKGPFQCASPPKGSRIASAIEMLSAATKSPTQGAPLKYPETPTPSKPCSKTMYRSPVKRGQHISGMINRLGFHPSKVDGTKQIEDTPNPKEVPAANQSTPTGRQSLIKQPSALLSKIVPIDSQAQHHRENVNQFALENTQASVETKQFHTKAPFVKSQTAQSDSSKESQREIVLNSPLRPLKEPTRANPGATQTLSKSLRSILHCDGNDTQVFSQSSNSYMNQDIGKLVNVPNESLRPREYHIPAMVDKMNSPDTIKSSLSYGKNADAMSDSSLSFDSLSSKPPACKVTSKTPPQKGDADRTGPDSLHSTGDEPQSPTVEEARQQRTQMRLRRIESMKKKGEQYRRLRITEALEESSGDLNYEVADSNGSNPAAATELASQAQPQQIITAEERASRKEARLKRLESIRRLGEQHHSLKSQKGAHASRRERRTSNVSVKKPMLSEERLRRKEERLKSLDNIKKKGEQYRRLRAAQFEAQRKEEQARMEEQNKARAKQEKEKKQNVRRTKERGHKMSFELSDEWLFLRAYAWYSRLAQPNLTKFKERLADVPNCDISPEDAERLPWNSTFSRVNISKAMNMMSECSRTLKENGLPVP